MRAALLCGEQHAHVITGDTPMLTSKAKFSDWQRQSQPSGWLRSPSPARLPPSPPAIQSVQDAGWPCRSAAPWPTSGVTHIGPVWPNMASKSNLKGVNERSRLFVGAIISQWRRWIASPPCSAIRPRRHLPLGEDTARPPYQATIAWTGVQVCRYVSALPHSHCALSSRP